MPYKTNQDLPDSVRKLLPEQAQDIYREAFNNAYEQYQDPNKRRDAAESLEQVSHKIAWSAVKAKYTKTAEGHWQQK